MIPSLEVRAILHEAGNEIIRLQREAALTKIAPESEHDAIDRVMARAADRLKFDVKRPCPELVPGLRRRCERAAGHRGEHA